MNLTQAHPRSSRRLDALRLTFQAVWFGLQPGAEALRTAVYQNVIHSGAMTWESVCSLQQPWFIFKPKSLHFYFIYIHSHCFNTNICFLFSDTQFMLLTGIS